METFWKIAIFDFISEVKYFETKADVIIIIIIIIIFKKKNVTIKLLRK